DNGVPGHMVRPGQEPRHFLHIQWRSPSRAGPAKEASVNLASNLKRSTEIHPDRPAVRLDETVLTYRTLDERSARVAGLLRDHDVVPGDRVAVMLPNTPAFAVVYYGVLRAGGVVVPMNPLLKGREITHYLQDSGAKVIFVGPQLFAGPEVELPPTGT